MSSGHARRKKGVPSYDTVRGGSMPGTSGVSESIVVITKLALRLVNAASDQDTKGFVRTVRDLKPVVANWKDEVGYTTSTDRTYKKSCRRVERALTALLQAAKAVLDANSADFEEKRLGAVAAAKELAGLIAKWKSTYQQKVQQSMAQTQLNHIVDGINSVADASSSSSASSAASSAKNASKSGGASSGRRNNGAANNNGTAGHSADKSSAKRERARSRSRRRAGAESGGPRASALESLLSDPNMSALQDVSDAVLLQSAAWGSAGESFLSSQQILSDFEQLTLLAKKVAAALRSIASPQSDDDADSCFGQEQVARQRWIDLFIETAKRICVQEVEKEAMQEQFFQHILKLIYASLQLRVTERALRADSAVSSSGNMQLAAVATSFSSVMNTLLNDAIKINKRNVRRKDRQERKKKTAGDKVQAAKAKSFLDRFSGQQAESPSASLIYDSDDEDAASTIEFDSGRIPNLWKEKEGDPRFITYSTEDGKQTLRTASLIQLVYKMTSPDDSDIELLKAMIMTYRTFTTPHTLLTYLTQRFEVPASHPQKAKERLIQLRVYNVIRQWISLRFDDWDQPLVDRCRKFLEEKGDPKMAKQLLGSLDKAIYADNLSLLEESQRLFARPTTNTQEIMTPQAFLALDETKIAEQMTLINSDLFRKISVTELLSGDWAKENRKHKAPTVISVINRFNMVSMWVASSILWLHAVKERARLMTKFIKMMLVLFKLNNLSGVMSVLAGLRSASVNRLKFTYEAVPQKILKKMYKIEEIVDSSKAYKRYREHLRAVNPPLVPYTGVYLTDLTFIEQGNASEIDGLIYYKKRVLMYGTVSEIIQYQQGTYADKIVRIDNIANFLQELPTNDENTLFQMSLLREPRGADRNDVQ